MLIVMVKACTHVSVYLHLMKGPYDDKLEQSGHWPLSGTFTVELLKVNGVMISDSDHYSSILTIHVMIILKE